MFQFNKRNVNHFFVKAFLLFGFLFTSSHVLAASVMQMNLSTLVDRSEKIFSGTVMKITEDKIEIGGGFLPVLHYRVLVSDMFKGEYIEEKGNKFVDFTTLGTLAQLKAKKSKMINYLQKGQDYLLMVGANGPVGITSTVGLSQGAFELFESSDKNRMALNGANNVGLFRDMANVKPTAPKGIARLPSSSKTTNERKGAVHYKLLADLIRARLEARR